MNTTVDNNVRYYLSSSSSSTNIKASLTETRDGYAVKLESVLPKKSKVVFQIEDPSEVDDAFEDAISISGVHYIQVKNNVEMTIIGDMTIEDLVEELGGYGKIIKANQIN